MTENPIPAELVRRDGESETDHISRLVIECYYFLNPKGLLYAINSEYDNVVEMIAYAYKDEKALGSHNLLDLGTPGYGG